MYLIYCFTAFLSLSLHNASRNVAEEDGDIPPIYANSGISFWFLVVGLIMPIVTMFFYTSWYWAIVINIVMIMVSMIIGNYFTYNLYTVKKPPLYIPSRVDARPSIILSLTSLVLFLYIIL